MFQDWDWAPGLESPSSQDKRHSKPDMTAGTPNALAAKVGAFVEGSANFLKSLGIQHQFAIALMGVFVASFAATTLDTACRLQRYVIQELAGHLAPRHRVNGRRVGEYVDGNPLYWLTNRHVATIFAIVIAYLIARLPGGEGKAREPAVFFCLSAINNSSPVLHFWSSPWATPARTSVIVSLALGFSC